MGPSNTVNTVRKRHNSNLKGKTFEAQSYHFPIVKYLRQRIRDGDAIEKDLMLTFTTYTQTREEGSCRMGKF